MDWTSLGPHHHLQRVLLGVGLGNPAPASHPTKREVGVCQDHQVKPVSDQILLSQAFPQVISGVGLDWTRSLCLRWSLDLSLDSLCLRLSLDPNLEWTSLSSLSLISLSSLDPQEQFPRG